MTDAHDAWTRDVLGADSAYFPAAGASGAGAGETLAGTGDEPRGVLDSPPIDDPTARPYESIASAGNMALVKEVLEFLKSKGALFVKVAKESGVLAKVLGSGFVPIAKAAELIGQAGPELWKTFKAAASQVYKDAKSAAVLLYKDLAQKPLNAISTGEADLITEKYKEALLDLKVSYQDKGETFNVPVFAPGSHLWPKQFDDNPKLVQQSVWAPDSLTFDLCRFTCVGVGHLWNSKEYHVSFGPLTIYYFSDGRFLKDINLQIDGQVQSPFHVQIKVTNPSQSVNMGAGGSAFAQIRFEFVLSCAAFADFKPVTKSVNAFLDAKGKSYFQPKSFDEKVQFPDGMMDWLLGKPVI